MTASRTESEAQSLSLADWRLADTVFDQLLQIPASERSLRLSAWDCPERVRLAVNALLIDATAGSPLDQPLAFLGLPLAHNQLAGQALGRWQLLDELGRGGMAVVYRARNIAQPEHIVALKIMQPQHDSAVFRARFLDEISLLARLNHPQVAQFFEAGEWRYQEQDLLWLAMRQIEGQPIDAWCRNHQLSTRGRVRLFLSVCDAVAYAHAQLIVHCDLKPNNIWVERQTGQPVVLDFGVAAVLENTDGADSGSLRFLSPAYAAPEQFQSTAPNTSMDLYGLGATLFQVLTEQRPPIHRPGQAPGVVAAQIAKTLQVAPMALAAIVRKAMSVQPEDRYGAVQALRDDLERYLTDQPVVAMATSWRYRMSLGLKRHRGLALSIASVSLALLLGLVSALILAQRARVESERARAALILAQQSEAQATAEAERANELKRFSVSLFESTVPTKPATEIPPAAELLLAAEDRARHDQTLGVPSRLEMLLTLAMIYQKRNLMDRAIALSDEALIQAKSAGSPYLLAMALRPRARLHIGKNEYDSATALLAEAETLLTPQWVDTDVWYEVRFEQASIAMFKRDFVSANRILDHAISRARQNKINPETFVALLNTHAICLKQMGRLAEAAPLSLETLQWRERMLGPSHRVVALSLVNHANLLGELGRFSEASMQLERAGGIYAAIADPSYEPAAAFFRSKGDLAWLEGDFALAATAYAEVNARYAQLRSVSVSAYPFTYADLARLQLAQANPGAAIEAMNALYRNAGPYLQQYGASLNLRAFDALTASAYCQADRPSEALAERQRLETIDLNTIPLHLQSEYEMALWECARASDQHGQMRALEARIRARDGRLPLGRARDVRSRMERFEQVMKRETAAAP